MPHDKNGQELKVGDTVAVEAVVTAIFQTDDYCNVNLNTVEPMFPGNDKTFLVLNTKQVEKLDK